MYVHALNSQLYRFSTNVAHKNLWVDENFYTNRTMWYNTTTTMKKKILSNVLYRSNFSNIFNINVANYSDIDVLDIYNHKKTISDFFMEEDTKQKEIKFLELTQELQTNSLNYIYSINLFISSTHIKKYNNSLVRQINKHVYNYAFVYKLHN